MRLILPVPPSANRWSRVGKGHLYTPKNVLEFQKRVMVEVRNARIQKIPEGVPVVVTFWWYRQRQAGDLDKRIGITLDALQGHWYENDRQVAVLHCYRMEDRANPRLEVEVKPIDAKAA